MKASILLFNHVLPNVIVDYYKYITENLPETAVTAVDEYLHDYGIVRVHKDVPAVIHTCEYVPTSQINDVITEAKAYLKDELGPQVAFPNKNYITTIDAVLDYSDWRRVVIRIKKVDFFIDTDFDRVHLSEHILEKDDVDELKAAVEAEDMSLVYALTVMIALDKHRSIRH